MPSDPDSPSKLQAYVATRGLRGKRVILSEVEEVVDRLAEDLVRFAQRRVSQTGEFHLALSGGSTPRALYQQLIIDPRYRSFPWKQTHLWIVDERVVPFDSEQSNWKMIRESIVEHVPMPEANAHPMPVLDAEGDRDYERDLRAALAERSGGRLDFVLLGMGGDGHTASLFPRTAALHEKQRWVVFNDGPTIAAPRPRMTMTYPLLNGAREVAILVTGDAKHGTLQHVSVAGEDLERFPVTAIAPRFDDAELTWYLDAPAAAGAK